MLSERCRNQISDTSEPLEAVGSHEPALHIANQLRTAVEALRFHFRGIPVRVTVSCGITELHPGDASEAAFDRADSALYRAKNSGKNLCVAA